MTTTVGGLSTQDLEMIREQLAAGRKPKVVFTEAAGQIAGQLGQVVELADPATAEEWIVVRFGRDELPFSPTDLRIAPKGATGRRAEPPAPAPRPEFKLDTPPPPSTPAAAPTPAQSRPAAGASSAGEPRPPRRAAKSAKPKGPAGLTVTLAYADGEWTVAATQGSKSLARPYVLRPVEALKMVSLIDVPGVQEAVEQILAAERAAAEQEAQRLRAELAEVEARLAELSDVS